jgi:transcriptional regulator of heat shock response
MKAVDKLEDDLMEIEMLLQDALHTSVQTFKDMVNGVINDMKQKTIAFTSFVQEQSVIFGEKLTELAITEQAKFGEKIDLMDGNYPEDDEEFDMMLELLGDKDQLMQWVDTSKEFFDKEIGKKEAQITKAILQEQKLTEDNLAKN